MSKIIVANDGTIYKAREYEILTPEQVTELVSELDGEANELRNALGTKPDEVPTPTPDQPTVQATPDTAAQQIPVVSPSDPTAGGQVTTTADPAIVANEPPPVVLA